jgi:hypothetical protein
MLSADHPLLLVLAAAACVALAFPLARFFFDDFESFKEEFGLSRDWERELWLLGFIPSSPMLYVKVVGFIGTLVVAFLALYSLLSNLSVAHEPSAA